MDTVVKKLKEYSNQIDLKNRFLDDFDVTPNIFNPSESDELLESKSTFEKTIKLKWLLKKKYQNNNHTQELDFWIINGWGGIRSFKPNEKNIEKINKFKKQINNKRLSKDSFSTISSLSKLSSFIDPDNFVIYDSRVIYTLNWLILTCINQNGIKQKYFPMPIGRNKIVADFDMNTIINLFHINEYSQNKDLYISEQDAYFEFCDFIKSNVKKVYGEESKPYELEMLLFSLADKEIFHELKNNIKITAANNRS